MKHFFIYWTAILFFCGSYWNLAAQSANCSFPSLVDTNHRTYLLPTNAPAAPAGNEYDCLGSTPNATWYYFQVIQPGTIDIRISNSMNVDIDFILWGSFNSLQAATSQCGNLGNGTTGSLPGNGGSVINCSYSGASTEYIHIANAQVGQVYVLLITNFSNAATTLTFTGLEKIGLVDTLCYGNIEQHIALLPSNVSGTLTGLNSSNNEEVFICGANSPTAIKLGFKANHITDTLSLDSATTNFTIFNPSQYTLVPSYPIAGRYDTLEIDIVLTPNASNLGEYKTWGIGIQKTDTLNRTCIQTLYTSFALSGVPPPVIDTCAGATCRLLIPAIISPNTNPTSYTWAQVTGLPVTITNSGVGATVSVIIPNTYPSLAAQIAVTVTYTGCTVIDTVLVKVDSVYGLPLSLCSGNSIVLGIDPNSYYSAFPLSSFVWSPATGLNNSLTRNPTSTITNTTTYQVTITTQFCKYRGSQTVTVNPNSGLTVIIGGTGLACADIPSGTVGVTTTGGVSPFQYHWNTGATTAQLSGLNAGVYTATTTDANNCFGITTMSIAAPPALTAHFSNYTNTDCAVNNGTASITVTGGVSPYQYLWNNGYTANGTQTGLTNGTYTSTITDANGCFIQTDTIQLGRFATSAQQDTAHYCIGDTILINGISYTFTTTYLDTIIGIAGCDTLVQYAIIFDSCSYVWPGDANNDQLVDNNDFLPIGVYNLTTGNSRTTTSTAWQEYTVFNWNQNQANGANLSHTDCNGNGTIRSSDTTAIVTNYGLSHLRTIHYNTVSSNVASVLYLVPQQSSYHLGETVLIDVMVGDINYPLANIAGLALKVNLGAIFEAGTINWAWRTNSFIAQGNTAWRFSKVLELLERIDATMVRHDGTAMGGYGKVATFSFVLREDLVDSTAMLTIIDYQAIASNGQAVILNPQTAVLNIDLHPTGVRTVQAASHRLQILPNPYQQNGILQYELVQDADAQLAIYNALGQRVHSAALGTQSKGTYQYSLPTHLTNGAYWLELQTNQQKSQIKFVKLD